MNYNHYKDYSVNDFMDDSNFAQWALGEKATYNKFWEDFFAKYPEQATKAEQAKTLLLDLHLFYEEEEHNLSKEDLDFEAQLGTLLEENTENTQTTTKGNRRYWIGALAVAASLLFLYLNPLSWQFKPNKQATEFVTGHGEWEQILLPDSSLVELNANSQLVLLDNWEVGNSRKVWLKGEAYFDIKKAAQPEATFSVVTKDLRVEVLGTSFQVNTRNQQTEVFLEEGEIRLELDKQQSTMQPGDFVTYSLAENKIAKTNVQENSLDRHWREGVVTLKDASMDKIIQQLEVLFGIDVIVEDAQIKEISADGKITIPVDNLPIATKILERVLEVQITIEGKQLFFHKKRIK